MIELMKEKSLIDGLKLALKKSKNKKSPIAFSYTYQIDVRDILPFLSHPSDKNLFRVYWEQPLNRISFAGLGKIIAFDIQNFKSKLDMNRNIIKFLNNSISISDDSLIYPKIFGGHCFSQYNGSDQTWKNFPKSTFHFPECLATLTDDGSWLTISKLIYPSDMIDIISSNFKKLCISYNNRLSITLPSISRVSIKESSDIPSESNYKKIIHSVLNQIKPKKIEKVVISRSQHLKIDDEFDVISAMQVLRYIYPKCTNYFFEYPDKGIFFGSTPERLVSLKAEYLCTDVLAGTVARGKNMEEDRLLEQLLINSHKERQEHTLVLEQVVKKLRPISKTLKYPKYPQIMKLKNLQHLYSPITCQLNDVNCQNIFDVLYKLHPTSAVAGTPTREAINIIKKYEFHDRGWYSGPIGWIDQNCDGDFFVAIRSALVKDHDAYIFSGAGIVAESLPDKEWEETKLKIKPILSALTGGRI